MLEIAGGIVLAVLILCCLPFLLIGALVAVAVGLPLLILTGASTPAPPVTQSTCTAVWIDHAGRHHCVDTPETPAPRPCAYHWTDSAGKRHCAR